ncbi:ribonuclease H-like domain-containing protein [Tanacetum coccineum]
MRTKPGVDSLSFDDLYNNLIVFETDVKGSTGSSSSAHNATFVSSESTSSTNDIDESDLEEMDLKWQVAMISMRLKKFYKKTGRKLQFDAKEPVGFDKTKVECFNCYKIGHFVRECRSKGNQDIRRRDAGNTGYKAKDNRRRPGKQEEPKALVTLDEEGVLEEPKPAKKMTRSDFDAAQVARDAEVARQLEVELQAEVERERQREEQASMYYIANWYDEVQARIYADYDLAIVLEEPDSTKVEDKQEAAEQGTRKTPGKVLKMKARKKRKGGPRMKRQSKRKKTDYDLEEEEHLNTFLKIVPDEEGIIDFQVLEKRFPIINWELKFYHFDRYGA